MAIGQELLNVPMGDMIRQMATAIADGQMQLDATSIEVAEMMGGLVGSSRVDLQACKLEYSIVSPK